MPSLLARPRRYGSRSAPGFVHQSIPIRPPWLGYIPDIYGDVVGLSAASSCSGLFTFGMRLQQTDGFAAVDSANLPLGENNAGAAGSPATSGFEQKVVGLGYFPQVPETNEKIFAITEKSAATAEGRMWVISSGSWVEQDFDATDGANHMTTDGLYDWTVFPGGTPATKTSNGTVETSSVLVFTNDGNHVFKYPRSDAVPTEYGRLTTASAFGASFKARSVESFFNRVVFLNTEEGGTRYHQRFRWTPIGTADPQPVPLSADPGGSVDLYVFEQEGLRCLAMGNLVALYFKDGVAFAHPVQDIALDVIRPFNIEVVSQERGPISTHAVVAIGQNRHFMICNDGWWILDSTGDWFEAGRLTLGADSTKLHRGQSLTKWKIEFYSNLNRQQSDKVTLCYDAFRSNVLIAWPSAGSTENNRFWRYDILTDSLWPDDFGQLGDGTPETDLTPTCLASVNRSVVSSETWASILGLEVYRFRFTAGTAGAGNVTFGMDGTDVVVALGAGATTTQCATTVGSNPYQVAFEATGWMATYTTTTDVLFYATTEGNKAPTFSFTDTDGTGAAGNFTLIRNGSNEGNIWTTYPGTWAGAAPDFGDVIPWHGTQKGQIFIHDYSLLTKAGVTPSWHWRSHEHNWGATGHYKMLHRLSAEIKKQSTPQQVSFEAFSQALSSVTSVTVQVSPNTMVEAFEDLFADLRHTDVHMGYGLSGSGPVQLSQFVGTVHYGPEVHGDA